MIEQVTGQSIIDEVLSNMQQGVEPLRYVTLVPSVYNIYLHPDDFDRLEGIFPYITKEAEIALTEQLARMNKKGWAFGGKKKTTRYETAQARWVIKFHKDADDDLQRGEILIDSQLALPEKPEIGVGTQTVRITTLRSMVGESRTLRRSYEPSTRVYATIDYEDNSGRQSYSMTKSEIVIGRGGREYITDLKLYTSPDVSREHLRIRFDAATGRFFIRDVSTLGTTVNGQIVPSSVELVGEAKRDRNIEVPLPPRARIGLADVLYLDFQAAINR